MLTASRFTNLLAKKTRTRLEQALDNRKPISRRDRNRPAVMAIQAALADLNRDYLLSAEVDGYFGSRTYSAVETFQRDYGLVADGQVGRQTLTQLDALYGDDVMRKPRGMSLHVGVDRVDPKHYGGEFALNSCVNDAKQMRDFAEDMGYETVLLADEEATTANFTAFMRGAIDNLFDGDSLFVTFSGHGSQVRNNSVDAEEDGMDETLCFFDRMLVDDEMYNFLSQLGEGVRVHLVFDSCHSGSAAKVILADVDDKDAYADKAMASMKSMNGTGGPLKTVGVDDASLATIPISSKSLMKALDGDAPDYQAAPTVKEDHTKEIAKLFGDLYVDENGGPSKSIEFFSKIYNDNKALYDAITNLLGGSGPEELRCTVVSLSACQDQQTTPAGSFLSLFTANVDHVWSNGGFQGSYQEFYKAVVRSTDRPDVVPALNTYGPSRANSRLQERPFAM